MPIEALELPVRAPRTGSSKNGTLQKTYSQVIQDEQEVGDIENP